MKRLYIAYGSNLSVEQMARRCPTATIVGTAILDGWRLLFNGPASIERKEGYQVPVLIWDIKPNDERSLLNGAKEQAMVYIMNTNDENEPGNYYYKILEDGYKEFGFNLEILQKALLESRR